MTPLHKIEKFKVSIQKKYTNEFGSVIKQIRQTLLLAKWKRGTNQSDKLNESLKDHTVLNQ